MKLNRRLAAGMLMAPLVLAACTSNSQKKATAVSGSGSNAGKGGYGYTIAVVTHGQAGDSFWSVVKAGVEKAGKDMGDKVSYQSDGDPAKQSQLIDAAVNQKVDGLVVSMANPPALEASIKRAISAGIPVITINSGQSESKAYGAITHVGQDEVIAGRGAGAKLKAAGVTKLLCVIQEAGNIGLEQRCQGAKEALGGTVENLQVDNNNLPAAQNTIKAKLQSDKSINGVLTLGPAVAAVAVQSVSSSGSSAKLATFDLNSDVVSAIESGKILFAVDQQQFEQGYIPIVLLTLYKSNLNTLGGDQPVLTGPGYVTKDNAAKVADLAKAGTR